MDSGRMKPPTDLIDMGRVLDAFGVRGQLKVEPYGGPGTALASARRIWLTREGQTSEWTVLQRQVHGQTLILSLEGFADREFAASWKGAQVALSRARFPQADDDEIYWVDLIGCEVIGQREVFLGTVLAVQDHGGGPFLQIRAGDGADRIPERLIPFVKTYITEVDLAQRRIIADWDPDWD